MKFKDGYMISSGQPVKDYIDSAVRHVLLRQVCCYSSLPDTILFNVISHLDFNFFVNFLTLSCDGANKIFLIVLQGVLGIKVKIMLDWDPKGKQGPKTPLPDIVTIHTPKEEEEYSHPAIATAPVLANDIEVPVA